MGNEDEREEERWSEELQRWQDRMERNGGENEKKNRHQKGNEIYVKDRKTNIAWKRRKGGEREKGEKEECINIERDESRLHGGRGICYG